MNLEPNKDTAKVIAAIKEQAEALCVSHPGMATKPRGRLGEILAEVTPGDLKKHSFAWAVQKPMRMP